MQFTIKFAHREHSERPTAQSHVDRWKILAEREHLAERVEIRQLGRRRALLLHLRKDRLVARLVVFVLVYHLLKRMAVLERRVVNCCDTAWYANPRKPTAAETAHL